MTRGAGGAPWSGPPVAHRHGTTSSPSRGSAPRRRPSTCTTRRSPRWSTPTTKDSAVTASLTHPTRRVAAERSVEGTKPDEERDLDLRHLQRILPGGRSGLLVHHR